MKTKQCVVFAYVAALCALAGSAFAQNSNRASGRGLNGQNYVSLTYLYTMLDDGPPDYYHGVGFRLNHAFWPNIDLIVTGGATQSDRIAGMRAKSRDIEAGLRLHTEMTWGRPFVEATLGGAWFDFGGFEENSYTYAVGFGAEFQITEAFSVAPLLGYSDAPDFGGDGDAFGVLRTNYWLNDRWSIRANFSVSDDEQGIGLGVAWGF